MSEDCPHCVFEKTEANCRGCFEGSHYKPKPITNADRIRAMTDEELAEFITNTDFCELLCLVDSVCKDGRCDKKLLDWLREEVAHD